jgi:hypothetical protein
MQIKISRSSRACHATGQAFEHDQELVSLVRMVEDDLVREDYLKSSWEAGFAKGAYSVWSTRYYDPQVAEQEPEEVFSPLRHIFYEAVASEDRLEVATAFMAAQMLKRQRVFKQLKESEESEEDLKTILYSDRIGNRLIEVKDPHFTYAELQEGSARLMARLTALEEEVEEESEENGGREEEHSESDAQGDQQPAEPAMAVATETGEADGSDEKNE